MVDLPDRWITDTATSSRFPHYTRANADEVGPAPFTPLGWSLGWVRGVIPGVAEGFVDYGVVDHSEFVLDPPEVFGNWGGYFYNQLSLPRVMGVRMPGASPDLIDNAYFGSRPGVPPYEPDPADDSPVHAGRLGESMAFVMSAKPYRRHNDAVLAAQQARRARPDLAGVADHGLLWRIREMISIVSEVWVPYCEVCLGSSLGAGAVQAVCGALGRADDAVRVLSAVGGVASADLSLAMWDLSRTVRGSTELQAAFDAGVPGLLDRLGSSAEATAFRRGVEDLLARFGHRGPNEWDLGAASWGTDPTIPLGMLDHLRRQDDARSPRAAATTAAAERVRLLGELSAALAGDPETQGTLQAGAASAAAWLAMREQGKDAVITVLHEARLCLRELGRRRAAIGQLDHADQVFQLLGDELDDFVADGSGVLDTLRAREAVFVQLAGLEPPYIISHGTPVPPLSAWPQRGGSPAGAPTVAPGEVLQGSAASPGTVTGRARVVLDPGSIDDLEPGDVMIAPTTDPSWTPLFLAVAGVVSEVGAVASHAAIASRELGIPCAVSVLDATRRIPDGAIVTLDGAAGTVTVVSVP
jgi:phosphohistidine swiveling domain-containing protein